MDTGQDNFLVSGFRNPAHLVLDVLRAAAADASSRILYNTISSKLGAAVLYLDKGTRMVSNPSDMEFFVFL